MESSINYSTERAVAAEAVREAARLCQAVQQTITTEVLQKADKSPVTVADFGSQALVCRMLRERLPDDPVVAEEDAAELRKADNSWLLDRVVHHVGHVRQGAGSDDVCAWIDHGGHDASSQRYWTLDPIDGTKGFLRGQQYAIALALIDRGQVQVAALCCPNLPSATGASQTGVVYTAVRGKGVKAFDLNGDPLAEAVSTSDLTDSTRARFCESVESGHSSHGDAAEVAARLGMTGDSVRLDSQAKYAVVARGEADIYMRLPTRPGYVEKIWDHAAGMLVVTEAGGRVTDITGADLDFSRGAGLSGNRGVIATNGHLHEAVLEALAAVGVA